VQSDWMRKRGCTSLVLKCGVVTSGDCRGVCPMSGWVAWPEGFLGGSDSEVMRRLKTIDADIVVGCDVNLIELGIMSNT